VTALKRQNSYQNLAFTLLELLAVIVILGVLISLLVPEAAKFRKTALSAACVSNLKTATAAMRLYIAEGSNLSQFKKTNEIYSFLGGSWPGDDTWSAMLVAGGYISDRRVLRCPAGAALTSITDPRWFYETYGLNMVTQPGLSVGEVVSNGGFSGGVFHLNASIVERPSRLILLADSRAPQVDKNGKPTQRFRLLMSASPTDAMDLRHNGRANASFLDGHVSALDPMAIVELKDKPYVFVPYYDKNGVYVKE
jgi:prepilin-type processing-associated H-X9-DG protein/prepilin-type N-terminal cleavage/methylation domain-containing protein